MHRQTTDEEVKAFDIVRTHIQRICADAGLGEPEVRIVQRLGRRGSDLTARFRVQRGSPMVEVPVRVVREYPREGLVWLLAHEVGHYSGYEDRRVKDRLLNLGIALLLALVFAATVWFVVGSIMEGSAPTAGRVLTSACIAVVAFYTVVFADSRREERQADRFAVSYQGSMDGAEQWAAFSAAHTGQRTPSNFIRRQIGTLFNTHPYGPMRLKSMRVELERQN